MSIPPFLRPIISCVLRSFVKSTREGYQCCDKEVLKRCTRSLSKPRSYEKTMRCRFDPAPEPMLAEATHLAPPCCVSTHRSRVVDPDGSTTFLDHREALSGIPQMTSFTQESGHLERLPVESSHRLHPYLRTRTGERRHARWHLAHVDQTSHCRPSAA